MSELFNSSSTHFSSLLISDIILCCSCILSHPLYFSYFIFFSPYLLKLVSFLSPLFVTTLLLFLAFLTGILCDSFTTELTQSKASHFLAAYGSFLERVKSKKEDEYKEEFRCLEDLEMYEIVFGSSVMEFDENQVEILEENSEETDVVENKTEENPAPVPEKEKSGAVMEEKRLENFLKILDEFERMSSNVEPKKKVERQAGAKADKVVEKQKVESLVKSGSEATCNKTNSTSSLEEFNPKIKVHSQRVSFNVDYSEENGRKSALKAESSRTLGCNLGSSGSMRKEKEWKRTLACKLFEERHNVEGGEGMDSLWETYENESIKPKSKIDKNKKYKSKKRNEVEILEEYGHEDDEEIEGQLCCLQAIKLSAGKMNMGVGRPNLLKISKAIKGIGWLSSRVSRHSKKVHNNGDRY